MMSSTVARALVFVIVACCLGCGARESKLENGESVKTGKRSFDAYFKEVASLRDNVQSLNSDLFPIREPLVEHMDVSVDVSLIELMAETRKRIQKFKDYGVTLNLRLTPEPIVIKERGDLEEDESDDALIKAIQEAANRAKSSYSEYNQLLAMADDLEGKRNNLANRIDKIPTSDPARGTIETEIVAAGRVLDKVEKKLRRDTRTLAHFMVALADAVDTGAVSTRDTKCEDALAKVPKRRRGRRARGRVRPPPRPRPSGDGFEM